MGEERGHGTVVSYLLNCITLMLHVQLNHLVSGCDSCCTVCYGFFYAEILKCHAIHHSTIKFLIITPQGTISYVSHCAVGRISDKEIVEQSDLINYLLPGEMIIADRGFRCAIYAHMALAEIKIPLFAKGKKAV